MLDQEDRDVRWQSGEGGEDILPLLLRHASGGFVEQQHLRACGQRERDLQEPLLAVREIARRPVEVRFEAEAREQAFDFSDDLRPAAYNPPEISAGAVALRDRERQRLGGRQIGEKLIDLERAR